MVIIGVWKSQRKDRENEKKNEENCINESNVYAVFKLESLRHSNILIHISDSY